MRNPPSMAAPSPVPEMALSASCYPPPGPNDDDDNALTSLRNLRKDLQCALQSQREDIKDVLARQERILELLEEREQRKESKHSCGSGSRGAAASHPDVAPTVAVAADDSGGEALSEATSGMSHFSGWLKHQKHCASSMTLPTDDARAHWRRMIRKDEMKRFMMRPAPHKLQELPFLSKLINHRIWELFVITCVVLNVLFIGWQTQYAAVHSGATLPIEELVETVFCAIFLLELLLRLAADGFGFFNSAEWHWNTFDFVVVGVMTVEICLEHAFGTMGQLSKISMLRILRVLRIIRILKVIRLLSFFRELRMMVSSIITSVKSLIWVVMILLMLFYIFSISLVQGVVEYLLLHDSWSSTDTVSLRRYFGSLDMAVLSLFESMAGGISWGELVDVLRPLPGIYIAIFLVFLSFVLFAVVNIVTGIFVETAMQSGTQDRDTVVQEELVQKQVYVAKIQQCFQQLDTHNCGYIGIQELEGAVADEGMVAYINSLGLDISDVSTLFLLLDRDHSGFIDIEEFLLGCLRLKGEARSLDIAKLGYQVEYLMQCLERLHADMKYLLSSGVGGSGFPTTSNDESQHQSTRLSV